MFDRRDDPDDNDRDGNDDENDLERYIREAAQTPTTITAADLSPPVCSNCGKELIENSVVVVWDVPEEGDSDAVWRYRYCSEKHKDADMHARPSERNQFGRPERLTPADREKYE